MNTIQDLFHDLELRLQKEYTMAFSPSSYTILIEELKKEYHLNFTPHMPAIEWYKKKFDNCPYIVEIIKALAIRAYYYPKERLEIFKNVFDIFNLSTLTEFLSFDANRKELEPENFNAKSLANYLKFKEKAENCNITAAHMVYSSFLYDFQSQNQEYYGPSKIPKNIKLKFKAAQKTMPFCKTPKEVENLFTPLLPYYCVVPMSALILLLHYQESQYVKSTLPLFYNTFKKSGLNFNQLIYCWSDTPHTPLVRAAFIETEPQALMYFIQEGLYLSSTHWYKKELKTRLYTTLPNISAQLIKRVNNDYDWISDKKEELKTLLEQEKLNQKVVISKNDNTSINRHKNFKI